MEDVWDFDTIDVEVDKNLKKQTKRCNDAFLNNLCPDIVGEEVENEDHFDLMREGSGSDEVYGSDEEVSSESDQDSKLEFEYSTHDPKVKWNKMRPLLGESHQPPRTAVTFSYHPPQATLDLRPPSTATDGVIDFRRFKTTYVGKGGGWSVMCVKRRCIPRMSSECKTMVVSTNSGLKGIKVFEEFGEERQ
ncbi:unnamed protein product [Lactuca saligna]|uniref:Uncharacterized protein n=1 Tax=Lactuca saligna TaxID=75948 RepID=A0AA35VGT6_LACSI|nr:unnamed protein product [Lactuca saligna]